MPSITKEIKTMSMSDDNKVGRAVSLFFLSSDDQYRHYTSHWVKWTQKGSRKKYVLMQKLLS